MLGSIASRNNVKVFGKGTQPFMFAHGLGCDQHMWRYVAPAFADTHKIVLFDFVGAGESDISAYSPQRYGSLQGYADDVLEICEELDLRDVIFAGQSVSSMIGALAAIRRPELFSRLIMVGPSPCYINDAPHYIGGFERADLEELLDLMDRNYLGWASYMAPIAMKNPERPELADELERKFCATNPNIARQFAEVTFFTDSRADLPKLEVPSLILQCSDDSIAPFEVGDYLHRNLPHSTLHVLRATGHCPHMSHPEETIEAIKKYLANVAAPVSVA